MSTPCCQISTSYRLVVSEYEVPKVLISQECILFFETPVSMRYSMRESVLHVCPFPAEMYLSGVTLHVLFRLEPMVDRPVVLATEGRHWRAATTKITQIIVYRLVVLTCF